jgi:hypothetical protein
LFILIPTSKFVKETVINVTQRRKGAKIAGEQLKKFRLFSLRTLRAFLSALCVPAFLDRKERKARRKGRKVILQQTTPPVSTPDSRLITIFALPKRIGTGSVKLAQNEFAAPFLTKQPVIEVI